MFSFLYFQNLYAKQSLFQRRMEREIEEIYKGNFPGGHGGNESQIESNYQCASMSAYT